MESSRHYQAVTNIATFLEDLVSASGAAEVCQTIELRRKEEPFADARLFFKDRAWLASQPGQNFVGALTNSPAIASVHTKPTTISLRFADELVVALGQDFESGRSQTLDVSDLMPGKMFAVGFVGPNTSKALHVGHLRNLTIGNALASILAAAGAEVIRQSLVGDIGRNICEAMAGYQSLHDGEDPFVLGVKPDHFIGRIYAEYNSTGGGERSSAGQPFDPVTREVEIVNDLADTFMRRWLAGDPEIRQLWRQIRQWVLDGHRETLGRLGVQVDRHDYESDVVGEVGELMARMLRQGILRSDSQGRIVYESGRAEFELMVLVRNDGFPTEHARLFVTYCRLSGEWRTRCTYLDLAGTEWQPASSLHMELMRKLHSGPVEETHLQLFHGMVTVNDAKMASTSGEALLIDDLLDRLLSAPEIKFVAESSNGAVGVETVADMIVKGFFLCRPAMKDLEFSWDNIMGEKSNPGWIIARAWCRAKSLEETGPAAAGLDNAYRLALIRTQDFRRNLRQATRTYSLSGLASYLVSLSEFLLGKPADVRLARIMRAVLGATLSSLGLLATVPDQGGSDTPMNGRAA